MLDMQFMKHSVWSLQNFNTKRKLSASTINNQTLPLPCCAFTVCGSCTYLKVFFHTHFSWMKMRRLYCTNLEGTMRQTVVWLSSSYCKPLQRTSHFFQKGWSSRIASSGYPIRLYYFTWLCCHHMLHCSSHHVFSSGTDLEDIHTPILESCGRQHLDMDTQERTVFIPERVWNFNPYTACYSNPYKVAWDSLSPSFGFHLDSQ